MITSFEVGAVFRIINRASPTLTAILRQVRVLNEAIDKARLNLAELSSGTLVTAGLSKAVSDTRALAVEWANVAKNAAMAQRAIGVASTATLRAGAAAAVPPAAAGLGGRGGGGRHRPGWLGGHGHITGPYVPVPGGAHVGFTGGAAAAAGLLGYGAYQAAEMQDAVFQLIYHAGLEQNATNRARFRKILQDAMAESGYGLKDIAESAKQEIRMFQGTPGGGLEVLPEMLRAATIESRLKGSSPEESMTALIGLAHMTKQYSPEAIKKLAPAFAFLSTANPGSLQSIERAAGYAVPLLQSGLEVDPMQTLLLGTAMTRAGATSTKSGTWLREMALRAMPGTSLMTKIMFKKHEAALKEVGLVDAKDQPTWFTDGKPDLLKMLDIAGANAPNIPIERRAALERALFGAHGGGGFALLADPAVRQQVLALRKEMDSPEFKNRYGGFVQAYQEGSTVQQARTAVQEFNIVMMDLGQHTLPAVTGVLKDFRAGLEGLRSLIPGAGATKGVAVGTRALEGVIAGAAGGGLIGAFGGPVGATVGAAVGGVAGGVLGVAEQYMKSIERPIDRFSREVVITGNSAAQAAEGMKALGDAIRGFQAKPGGVFPGGTSRAQPISLSLNVDGRTLAQAISEQLENLYGFPTGAPSPDGASRYFAGDHNFSDT